MDIGIGSRLFNDVAVLGSIGSPLKEQLCELELP